MEDVKRCGVCAGMEFTDVRLDRILQALFNPSEQIRELRDSLSAASASTANSQVDLSRYSP